jgi:hypothetical protein
MDPFSPWEILHMTFATDGNKWHLRHAPPLLASRSTGIAEYRTALVEWHGFKSATEWAEVILRKPYGWNAKQGVWWHLPVAPWPSEVWRQTKVPHLKLRFEAPLAELELVCYKRRPVSRTRFTPVPGVETPNHH